MSKPDNIELVEIYLELMKHTPLPYKRFLCEMDTGNMIQCTSPIDLSNLSRYHIWYETVKINNIDVKIMFTPENPPNAGEVVRLINPAGGNGEPYIKHRFNSTISVENQIKFLEMGWLYPDNEYSDDAIVQHINAIKSQPMFEKQ